MDLYTYDSAHFEIQFRSRDHWLVSPTKHATFAEADKRLMAMVKTAVDNGHHNVRYRIVHRVATCEVVKCANVRPAVTA